jgi:hypothetical protein
MMSLCRPNNSIHQGVDFPTTHILDTKVPVANADYSYVLDSVVDPEPYPDWIRIQWGAWNCVRIQEGKNGPEIHKTVDKFHLLKCWTFSFKISCIFLVIKIMNPYPDPEPDPFPDPVSLEMLDPDPYSDPGFNESKSKTLVFKVNTEYIFWH